MNRKGSVVVVHIDDNATDRVLVRVVLNLIGINGSVLSLEDGAEGLAYLKGEGKFSDRDLYPWPSVIITDLQMPGIDGLTLLRMIKDNPGWASIPVVILSASEDPAHRQRAHELGASTYLVKPHSFTDLVDVITLASGKVRNPGNRTTRRKAGPRVSRKGEPHSVIPPNPAGRGNPAAE